jgi:hypothetical protein
MFSPPAWVSTHRYRLSVIRGRSVDNWSKLLAVPESVNLRLHLAPPVSSSRKPKCPRENSP